MAPRVVCAPFGFQSADFFFPFCSFCPFLALLPKLVNLARRRYCSENGDNLQIWGNVQIGMAQRWGLCRIRYEFV